MTPGLWSIKLEAPTDTDISPCGTTQQSGTSTARDCLIQETNALGLDVRESVDGRFVDPETGNVLSHKNLTVQILDNDGGSEIVLNGRI